MCPVTLETGLTNVIQRVPNRAHITNTIITILLLILLLSSSSSSYLKSLDGGTQLYILVKLEKPKPPQQKVRISYELSATWNKGFF